MAAVDEAKTAQQYDCALDLSRRLPPDDLPGLVERIKQVCANEDLHDEVLGGIDQPLKVRICPKTGREYLICDYNREGSSYRSPWSNEYDPPSSSVDAPVPTQKLRRLEVAANEAFRVYADMYYETGVISSVYLWDLDDGFAGVVLIKKVGALRKVDVNEEEASADASRVAATSAVSSTAADDAGWDSLHVFEASERSRQASYKFTSTIILHLGHQTSSGTDTKLSGFFSRQHEHEALTLDDPLDHVGNMGRIVEEIEAKMRSALHDVNFARARDIAQDLRQLGGGLREKNRQRGVQAEMVQLLRKRHEPKTE